MKKKNEPKSKKLYFQISAVIFPLFLLTAVLIAFVVYNSTLNGFLESQNSHMSNQLRLVEVDLMSAIEGSNSRVDWYFDKLEKYAGRVYEEPSAEQLKEYEKYIELDDGTLEWLEKVPESIQFCYVWKFYFDLYLSLDNNFSGDRTERMFILDASEPYTGMIICDYKWPDYKTIGEYYDFDVSELKALKSLIETDNPSYQAVFERSDSFPDKGNYYLGYIPVISENRTRAVIGVAYDWNNFNKGLLSTIYKMLIVCVGALMIVLILLQIIIYRRATAPITAIQETVREYKDSKDSGKVAEKMSQINVKNELGLLSRDISELAKEIDFYTKENIRLATERERVSAELDLARKIQADQLPSAFSAFPDRTEFDIFASMTPAKEVGGDFYDFFFVDDDHLALVIADVSGKGVPAALFMMMCKNLIKDHAMMKLSPKETAGRVNEMLCENNKHDMFVTAWIGILEIPTGRVTAVNAGHELPAILRPGGKFELFEDDHCFVLGGMKRMTYDQYEFTLPKGGTLFLYTDGVTEAANAADEMFGEERLVEALNKYGDVPPDKLLEGIRGEIDRFAGTAPQYDDITMLGIKLL